MKIIEQRPGLYTHFLFSSENKSPQHLFIELPHGATKTSDFKWYEKQLEGDFPKDVIDFFYVNTDVGSPEIAKDLALILQDTHEVHILQSHIPRTFIDCNRVVGEGISYSEGGVTPATPSYVRNSNDIRFLYSAYDAYQKYAQDLYTKICGQYEGLALMLHTYAPRSVPITKVDQNIVVNLHDYYDTEKIQDCKLRPQIDIIHKNPEGEELIDKSLIQKITQIFTKEDFWISDGQSYPLHPVTTAHRHAKKYPLQTICLEVRRDLIVQKWSPFEEMPISEENSHHIARCIAQVLSA